MADDYFKGMRGVADVVTSERPQAWRAGILRLFPNGMAPLTALTALIPSERVNDPLYHWWTKTLTTQRATLTGKYTTAIMVGDYASGGVIGQIIYCKCSLADSKMFRAGHQVVFRDTDDYTVDCVGKVTSVTPNGADSQIAVKLLEIDDNGAGTSHDISDCTELLIVGNINPQGGVRPLAISQAPTLLQNGTQIWRNSLDLTRTREQTDFRTGAAYAEAKRDCLEQHSIEMEKTLLWGIYTVGTGDNGQPETTTEGIITTVRGGGTSGDYSLDTNYSGKSWLEGGKHWLDEKIRLIFRYGTDRQRLVYCGDGALLAIQRMVEGNGMYQLSQGANSYGIAVTVLSTVFGTLTLQTHPLFSFETTNQYSMLAFEPKNLKWRFIQDTMFMADNTVGKGGGTGKDGREEEFLTEAGLEMHHPETCAWLNGVGQDNAL